MSTEEASIAHRVEQLKIRIQQHSDRVNNLKGRVHSLEGQLASYVAKLEESGITPDDLPSRIESLQLAVEQKLTSLESVLDSVEG